MRITFTYLFFLLCLFEANGQFFGTITNKGGEVLPFASVYVQGTSKGTTTNFEGNYFLELEPGRYKIVFQYVGYKQLIKEVDLGENGLELNVSLEDDNINLKEIIVKADAEDPAYGIIRKAIKKRKYYLNLVDQYSCDVYIKGVNKLLDAPEKIFGQELGDLGGSLDSNRQGIVYLSESEAKLYYQKPFEKKEQMISSKISGNDNGFSFNQASSMDFNFYENFIEIERNLISPIADNALAYYQYKLIGTLFDEEGRLINKIEVIPKRNEDPVFRGMIYIVEDLWNIQSTELMIIGATIKQPILDTLIITQIHIPIEKPETWMLLSQSLDFKFGLLGLKVQGNFTGIFSGYDLDPQFEKGFFNNEIFKVEEGANEKSFEYWDSIRPIPLTIEETNDYIKKDSLEKIWESKAYRDSMDRKNNKFKIINLLTGYSFSKSYKKISFSIGSPLTTIEFNPVQGYYGNLNIRFRKIYDEHNTKWLSIKPEIQYGLSDKKWRGGMEVAYNFSNETYSRLTISAGIKKISQFNEEKPISSFLNTYYSLLAKRNHMRIYEKDFAMLGYRRELINGLFFTGKVEYAQRSNLENTTNKSWYKKDRDYWVNIPNHPNALAETDSKDKSIFLEAKFRIRFNQKYISYPDQKFIIGSEYPDFWIKYKKGLLDADFDLLKLQIMDDISIGLIGESEFNIEGGYFLNNKEVRFIDHQHFNGNQTLIFNPDDYLSSFLLLPYYENSTDEWYIQGHYQHHFNGFLFDKIPLVRKLGLKSVTGASYLYTPEKGNYLEVSYGFENLGIGVFKIFRIDAVASFNEWKYQDFGVRLGFGF